jgi:hypothetical protein
MIFEFKLPHKSGNKVDLSDMDFEDLAYMSFRRTKLKHVARKFFKKEPSEEALRLYCEQTHQDYLDPVFEQEFRRISKIERSRLNAERYTCVDCGKRAVSLSQLCPSCAEFKRGMRTSMHCYQCGTTKFSADDITVVRSGYTEIEHG